METFALVLILTIAAPGAASESDAFILDHGLTQEDCAGLQAELVPSVNEMPGVTVYVATSCEREL